MQFSQTSFHSACHDSFTSRFHLPVPDFLTFSPIENSNKLSNKNAAKRIKETLNIKPDVRLDIQIEQPTRSMQLKDAKLADMDCEIREFIDDLYLTNEEWAWRGFIFLI